VKRILHSVPNFCGPASLRTTSAKQFFTARRKGAKKAFGSRERVSVPNRSGFASLPEASGTKGKGDFTPRRREGEQKEGRINLWLV
jgi:hypothetical protein